MRAKGIAGFRANIKERCRLGPCPYARMRRRPRRQGCFASTRAVSLCVALCSVVPTVGSHWHPAACRTTPRHSPRAVACAACGQALVKPTPRHAPLCQSVSRNASRVLVKLGATSFLVCLGCLEPVEFSTDSRDPGQTASTVLSSNPDHDPALSSIRPEWRSPSARRAQHVGARPACRGYGTLESDRVAGNISLTCFPATRWKAAMPCRRACSRASVRACASFVANNGEPFQALHGALHDA